MKLKHLFDKNSVVHQAGLILFSVLHIERRNFENVKERAIRDFGHENRYTLSM